jgi:hypothetical protein
MSSETDQQFVERISLDLDLSNTADIQRLFALARRGAAVQWRPIEEAPKDGTCIMVGAGKWEPEVACWSDSVWLTGWYCGGGRSDSYGPSFNPTHFMHLPPPPAGEPSDE